MKLIIILTFFVVIGSFFGVSTGDDSQLTRKPNETELFGFLTSSDNDWNDVLYICDFFKTFTFSCNVTAQGAEHIKNSSARTSPKPPKFVIQNVTGTWSEQTGIMKKMYSSVDYLAIVAKCLFRTEYYECFGVPRCDGRGGMAECHGGEPWRGSYEGAPNIGFKANITNMAQESPPMQKQEPQPANFGSEEVPNPALTGNNNVFVNATTLGSGQTLITLTNASGTFTATGNNGDMDGSFEVPANGSLSIVKVAPVSDRNGTTSGGVQVSSFSSFSTGSGGPSDGRSTFSTGFSGLGGSGGFGRRRPIFTNENDTMEPLGSSPVRGTANCSNPGDFSLGLRCLIQNFQKTIFQSMMNSFQMPAFQPFSRSATFSLPGASMMQQSQSQSMDGNGRMFQAQSPQGRVFGPRFGGFRVMIVPDNGPQQQPDARSDFDDDFPAWLSSGFRKK